MTYNSIYLKIFIVRVGPLHNFDLLPLIRTFYAGGFLPFKLLCLGEFGPLSEQFNIKNKYYILRTHTVRIRNKLTKI